MFIGKGKQAAIALLMSGISSASFAQQSDETQQPVAASDSGQLQEIIVTAQRRSERLQDIPVAVATVNAEALTKGSITNGYDLQKMVPSLSITTSSGAATPFIRGVGNSVSAAGNEASTAVYIDGVYIARVNPVMLELNNIERVEVLKGPQGTLFGRNATGGLIHLITSNPGDETVVRANFGYANYDTVLASLYASTSINEKIGMNIALTYRNQGEGWGKNVNTGGDVWFTNYFGARGKFVLSPTETTKITLAGDYIQARTDLSLYQSTYRGTTHGNPPGFDPTVFPSLPGFFDTRAGFDPLESDRIYGFSGRIDQELSFANLVSITAYRKGRSNQKFDVDYVPVDYFNADLRNRFNQFSQELQLMSLPGADISWIVGGYYLRSRDGYDPSYLGGAQFGGVVAAAYGKQVVKSYAAFGQATAPITSNTRLTLGLRYTIDDVVGSGRTDIEAFAGGPILVPGEEILDKSKFKKLTWRGALDHKFSEDVMAYASISRGYKAGVYQTLPFNPVPAEPEVLDAYEVGLKTEFFNNRVRVNGSLFYYDIKNPQVQLLQGASVQLLNAKSSRVKGIDLDLEAAVTRQLTVQLGVAILDAKYRNFQNAPVITSADNLVNGFVPGCSTPAVLPTPGNGGNVQTYCTADVSGNHIMRSPKFTGTGSINYSIPLTSGKIDLSVDGNYNSGFYWDPDNFLKQKSFFLLGASASYTFPGENLSIRGWAKNLTNKKHYNGQSEQSANFGNPASPAEPRTYGVSVGLNF